MSLELQLDDNQKRLRKKDRSYTFMDVIIKVTYHGASGDAETRPIAFHITGLDDYIGYDLSWKHHDNNDDDQWKQCDLKDECLAGVCRSPRYYCQCQPA